MKLRIDGYEITAKTGQSLLELIQELGLDSEKLSRRPLVAKIAGEVFTLNYIPIREKDAQPDRPSIRRAMAASGGEVRLLRYGDDDTKEPIVRWRGHANLLFSNWLNYFVYQSTPYDIMSIGSADGEILRNPGE